MPKLETVKVVNEDLESGFMVINKADFDKDKHKLFDEAKADSKPNAADTVKLVEACESLEDLEKFAGDDRKSVVKAVKAKQAELSGE